MKILKYLFIILIIVFVIVVLVLLLKKFKNPRINTLNAVDGTNGGGKTSSMICRVIMQLRRYYFLFRNWKLKNDYIILSSFPIGKKDYFNKLKDDKGNVVLDENGKPIYKRFIRIWFKKIYCYDLTLDLLTMQTRLKQDEVIIIIDEFSNIASQFDHQVPVVKDNMLDFIRNFRHYTNGKGYIYCCDQSFSDIFHQMRRRCNYVYNMISCFKVWLLPITIFEYRKILVSDYVQNEISVDVATNEGDIKRFIFFSNPFKWYDSYCYRDRYNVVPNTYKLTCRATLKRNDVLKLSPIYKMKHIYYKPLQFDNITADEYALQDKIKK